jgi:hypothetical protein
MVKYDQGHIQLDAHIDMPVCTGWPEPGIGADEVHPERPRSQGAQSFYHYRQATRRIGGCAQHTQSTGIGDRGRKVLVRDKSHTRSDEWMSEAIFPGQPGREGYDILRRARWAPLAVVDSRITGGMASPFAYSDSEYLPR